MIDWLIDSVILAPLQQQRDTLWLIQLLSYTIIQLGYRNTVLCCTPCHRRPGTAYDILPCSRFKRGKAWCDMWVKSFSCNFALLWSIHSSTVIVVVIWLRPTEFVMYCKISTKVTSLKMWKQNNSSSQLSESSTNNDHLFLQRLSACKLFKNTLINRVLLQDLLTDRQKIVMLGFNQIINLCQIS